MNANKYDAVIIGGGFFGCSLAINLARAGQHVLMLERDGDLMQRASYVNQARVHGGYHYPRSLLTALRSRVNLPVFSEEYADCIDTTFEKYYAIASQFTKVSARQFQLFCERIQAPIERAPEHIQRLFSEDLIEDVFTVKEYAFDSVKIKQKLTKQLTAVGVEWLTGAEANKVSQVEGMIGVEYTHDKHLKFTQAKQVFNCTYAHINQLNRNSGLPEIPLKHEIAELALITPPVELEGRGVTVMCGPFFSTMPFPSRNLYSFSHVRYTPHTEWHEPAGDQGNRDSYEYLKNMKPQSAYPRMIADAKRYMPSLARAKYEGSLFEIKTVLPQSEGDDSRPILFRRNHGLTGYTCVMGGKLDNIYDVYKELLAE